MTYPVKQGCKECPFRRASAPGWLGAASGPVDLIYQHWWGLLPMACHLTVNWEASDAQERALSAPLCHGFLQLAKNDCKALTNPEVEAERAKLERNTSEVFASLAEYRAHHGEG